MSNVLRSSSTLYTLRGERYTAGKALRTQCPRSSHAHWEPASNRPDPLSILESSNRTRVKPLVPIRYGRMLVSPYNFLRGSAAVMAHDLANTPITGISTQICGYLGKSETFAQSLAEFASAYADQNERDYASLMEAVKAKRITAITDV